MFPCKICGESHKTLREADRHLDEKHRVRPVPDTPMSYVLVLSDDCRRGRFEAAREFADAYKELKKLHPTTEFHLMPFYYEPDGLGSILAIAK